MKNEWESYVNGNSSQYNFTYQDKYAPSSPSPSLSPSPSSSVPLSHVKADKQIQSVNIKKIGGNKKYTRKSRKSVRK